MDGISTSVYSLRFFKELKNGSKGVSSSLTSGGVTVLCPWTRHFIRCLVLVQLRKTRPDMTEKLLTRTY